MVLRMRELFFSPPPPLPFTFIHLYIGTHKKVLLVFWEGGGLLNGRENFVHSFSPSLCKVCGYAPSTSILVHTYLRMPEYDLNCGLSYPFLYANYTAFHISYAKYAGMPPPLTLYFRPPLHWSAHVLYNDSSSSLRGGGPAEWAYLGEK